MNNHECNNCGAVLVSNQSTCKYCGSTNPNYEKPLKEKILSEFSSLHSQSSDQQKKTNGTSSKSKIVAGLLQIFIPIGIGRFYIQSNTIGVLQLITSFLWGIGSIWSIIDGIIILIDSNARDGKGNLLK